MGVLDQGSKRIAVADRRAFLHIAGCLPVTEKARVEVWDREVAPPQKVPDHLFMVSRGRGRTCIEHVESLATWRGREVNAIIKRALTISLVPKLSELGLRTTVILMLPDDVPPELPRWYVRKRWKLRSTLEVRYRRLWTMSGAALLALGRDSVLPLIPLARHKERNMVEAIERLKRAGAEELVAEFLSNAGRVYNEEEVNRYKDMFREVSLQMAKGSSYGRMLINEGRAEGVKQGMRKGRTKGRDEGAAKAMRDAIRTVIKARFPELALMPEIDLIPSARAGQDVLDEVARAKSATRARAAVLAAVEPAG